MQTSPRIMNVAVPWFQHSPMFGQLRLLAHGVEVQLAHQRFQAHIARRSRGAHLQPLGLGQRGSAEASGMMRPISPIISARAAAALHFRPDARACVALPDRDDDRHRLFRVASRAIATALTDKDVERALKLAQAPEAEAGAVPCAVHRARRRRRRRADRGRHRIPALRADARKNSCAWATGSSPAASATPARSFARGGNACRWWRACDFIRTIR